MAISVPIDVYNLLEDKLGKEDARRVASAIEVSLDTIEKRAEAVTLQKKLEIKDELTKELASKADLLVLESKLEKKIEVEIAGLEKKIEVEIANVKADLIKWMFRFWIGQLASLIAILKFFKF